MTLFNLLPQADIDAHRARALNPEHPVIRVPCEPGYPFPVPRGDKPVVQRGV